MTRPWTTRWGVRVLVLALAGMAGGLAWAGSVQAAGDGAVQVAINGAPFTDHPAAGLLDVTGLAPGSARSATFGVRTAATAAESLSLRVLTTQTVEDGCGAAEARCTGSTGELGLELTFAIAEAPSSSGPYHQVWHGSAATLGGGVATGVSVAAGADRWIRLTATVPTAAGNEIEGEAFRFALRVQLTGGGAGVTIGEGHGPVSGGVGGPAGGAQPGGAHSGSAHAGGVVIGGVSLTGAPLAVLLAGAALLGVAGSLLVLSGRRRPRPDDG